MLVVSRVRSWLSSVGGGLLLLVMVVMVVHLAEARRYRYCAEGCCVHEYCAYHKICYPKIHCGLGCPDGTCHQGVCMPPPPCNATTSVATVGGGGGGGGGVVVGPGGQCGMGQACVFHYNLGYTTCQYNLDIGRSLCVDSKGRSILKPLT
ncbi:uncharacterized protein LOC143285441 [Babylonia areolata]|uniref:uncharacterized protein LOC143285441 n=1 Tax=Babylonia areolata TaxID=304850 RepID=UPI003FD4A9EE